MPIRPARLARLVLVLMPLAVRAARAQPAPLGGLDAYIERGMREWRVPGLAIAVVRDTGVVLARGYGVRQVGRPEPVDAHTLFAVGSATKAFTAAALGSLVDERRLAWDDRVTDRLPGFQLFEAQATREASVRDVLTHRVGLTPNDLVWFASGRPRADVVRRLRWARPAYGFRTHFVYQNSMYVVAGEVLAAVAGRPWDDVVRERLLLPLGMRETMTSVRALDGMANVARPHAISDGGVRVIPYRDVDNAAAALGLNSSVADMARWLRFQLDSGRAGGRALLSRGTFLELHRPQMVVPLGGAVRAQNPHRHLRTYALGWYVEDYRGREVVWHMGATDGMRAIVGYMPEERVGVVALANLQGAELPAALMYRVFDHYLGAPPTDWSGVLLAEQRRAIARGRAFAARADSARVPNTRPSLPLAAYAGTYVDSLYGEVRVTHADGRLTIQASPGLHGELRHWHFDTFRTEWEGLLREGPTSAVFALDESGRPARLTLDLEGPPVTFVRVDDGGTGR